MLDDLGLDPHAVLGVSPQASAEEIRDAFHRQSKKHHPDRGGDDWAFRIVVRAYEILYKSVEREQRTPTSRDGPIDQARVRPGVHDKGLDPTRVVHVEMVWMRYEVGDFLELLTETPRDRNLSGSLNIVWPDPEIVGRTHSVPHAERILRALNAAFDELRLRTGATSARSHIEDNRFEAWIGYPSGQVAWESFKLFHIGLKARGLGVKQWTLDVTIPREAWPS